MYIRFGGGLGNQMFQYAFYLEMKYRYPKREILVDLGYYDVSHEHNGYEIERIFGLNLPKCSREMIDKHQAQVKKYRDRLASDNKIVIFYRILYGRYSGRVIEDHYQGYEYSYLQNRKIKKNALLFGSWQDEKYFADVKEQVRDTLIFPEFTDEKNILLSEALKENESVSVHVRRGDFVGNSMFTDVFSDGYYDRAIKYIKEKVKNPKFIVFSDDTEWCKINMPELQDAEYVSWNTGENSFRDIQLMSLCKHNIIANSTFSWWGAWLNANPGKIVVCPKNALINSERYNEAFVCDGWIKL